MEKTLLRDDGIMIKLAVTVMMRDFSEDFIKSVTKADRLKEGEAKDILAQRKGK